MFYDGLECVVCSFEIYLLGAVNIFLMGKEIYYYFDRQAARNFIEPKKKKKNTRKATLGLHGVNQGRPLAQTKKRGKAETKYKPPLKEGNS